VRFSHGLRYDASPAAVLDMLADPTFREKVCVALDALRHEVTIDGAGQGMTVVVDQTQPAQGIPSFARKVVGDELHVVQRESWRDDHSADLTVEIPGKPGRFTGTIELTEQGTGTVETVAGDVKVRLPMVAGKLESLIADLLEAALDIEQRVGQDWLTGRR
jgi:Protein of unknown function (DUF2505)